MTDDWIQTLLVLQEKDLRIKTLEQQIAAVPGEKAKSGKLLEDVEREAREVHDLVMENEKAVKETEITIQGLQEKLQTFMSKTAMIKDNEEYKAALSQIEQAREEIGEQETRELILLEEVDESRSKLADVNKRLEQTQARVQEMLADLDTRDRNFQKLLQQVRKERDEAFAAVPGEKRALYERLRKSPKFADRAVLVPIRDGICDGCHMKVTAQMRMDVRKALPVRCQNCGALLYDGD